MQRCIQDWAKMGAMVLWMNMCVKTVWNFWWTHPLISTFSLKWPFFSPVEWARSNMLLPLIALTAMNSPISLNNVKNHDVCCFGLAGWLWAWSFRLDIVGAWDWGGCSSTLKCLNFCALCGRGHIPLAPPPTLHYWRWLLPPNNFRILDRTLNF